jgi:perosamine synthetase
MTFAATAEVIRYFKAVPVFVDIDPVTMNIDAGGIEKCLSSRASRGAGMPKAIIPVHYAGYPCDMRAIMDIAKRYGLIVIEDAAHAFPALYEGRFVGTIGDITCFSFYATKNISTGEGGMATTANAEWAERMKIMSLHGISKDAWKRYTAQGNWYYEIIAPGYKYNLTDVASALGLAQLKRADVLWKRREAIAARYQGAFRDLAEIELPSNGTGHPAAGAAAATGLKHSWHLYVIRLNLSRLKIDRAHFIDELKGRGIGTSVHFIPLHIHPYYRDTFGYKPQDYPNAFAAYERIISLPIYPKMSDQDVDRVVKAVREVVELHRTEK